MVKKLIPIVGGIALGVAVGVPSVASANDEVMALSQDANNWVMWGRTYDGSRYSPLDQINKENAGDLQVAWTFSTGVLRGARRWAPGNRRHHVGTHPGPEQGVLDRPQRSDHQLDVLAETG